MQEWCNSIADLLELCLSCINPSIFSTKCLYGFVVHCFVLDAYTATCGLTYLPYSLGLLVKKMSNCMIVLCQWSYSRGHGVKLTCTKPQQNTRKCDHKISNIRHTNAPNLLFLVSSCSCLCPIQWRQVLSREWRCSWSSTDRRCSNYIWVIDNFIAWYGATYIGDLMVSKDVLNVPKTDK